MSLTSNETIETMARTSSALIAQVYRRYEHAINFAPYAGASSITGTVRKLPYLVFIVFILAAIFVPLMIFYDYPIGMIPFFVAVLAPPFGRYVYQSNKRYFTKSYLKSVIADERPPILYLRSFAADGEQLSRHSIERPAKLTEETWSIEEALARAIVNVGSLVAIGKPGDAMAEVGAGRIYVADEAWQDVASELMMGARAIVLRPGTSRGLKWEIEAINRLGLGEKTIFLTVDETGRPLGKDAYRQLAGWVNPLLNRPLPLNGWNSWFVALGPDWGRPTIDAVNAFGSRSEFQRACREFARRIRALKANSDDRRILNAP